MGEFNQAKYIQEYQKEKYDRCIFNVPKGQRKIIEEHWKSKGYKSLNTYINDLIAKDMNGNKHITVGDIKQSGKNNSINIG